MNGQQVTIIFIVIFISFFLVNKRKQEDKRQDNKNEDNKHNSNGPTFVFNVENKSKPSNCPNCNAPIMKEGLYCPYCGTKLPALNVTQHNVRYVDEARIKELEIQKTHEEHRLKLEEEKKRREIELEFKKKAMEEEREARRRVREDVKDFFAELFEGLLEKIGYAILAILLIGYFLFQAIIK